jgi:copper chaperone CopZ
MADMYNAMVVVLEKDVRDDCADPIINAIRMIKGVQSVEPHVSEIDEFVVKSRTRREIEKKVLEALASY